MAILTTDPILIKQEQDKQIYNNQKRKVRNKLIYLVGLHILFIFIFVGILCFEYLMPNVSLGNSFSISILSDTCFFFYIISILISIKFKNRKLLFTSIFTLIISIGMKTATLALILSNGSKVPLVIYAHVVVIIANCVVPWSLLLLWNKLN